MSAEARPAVVTPFWDGVAIGGLSIVGMGVALVAFAGFGLDLGPFRRGDWLVLAILVNTAHFMSSYRLLYGSMDRIRWAPWASVGVPAILLGLLAWRIFGPGGDFLGDLIQLVSIYYLAVHFTGQAWGMVATQAHLAGWKMSSQERGALRFGTNVFLAVHWLIALVWLNRGDYRIYYEFAVWAAIAAAIVSFVLGASTYILALRRREPVTLRAVIPWLALYFWYPAWLFVPGGPLWVQLSHALQYLSFPLRVEANRYVARTGKPAFEHVVLVYLGLVIAGALFLKGPNLAIRMWGPGWYSEPGIRAAFATWVHLISIHHFFIDGAVWKLRDASVRNELFQHTNRNRSAGGVEG